MDDVPTLAYLAADRLTDLGASFVLLVGSWARGDAGPTSDVDVAAHFGGRGRELTVRATRAVPPGVDLIVLDTAPLELAGRSALDGIVLRETEARARTRWVADTRKRYLDEQTRVRRSRADFVAARTGRS